MFYDGPCGSWMQGLDAGAVVHFVGQYWDNAAFTFQDLRPRPGFPTDPVTGDCSKFDVLVGGGAGGVQGAGIPPHHGPFTKDPTHPFFPCIGTIDRKVREWITLDLIVNYTFNLPPPAAQTEVAGYAKDGGKNVKMKDGKEKNVMPVSTAE